MAQQSQIENAASIRDYEYLYQYQYESGYSILPVLVDYSALSAEFTIRDEGKGTYG